MATPAKSTSNTPRGGMVGDNGRGKLIGGFIAGCVVGGLVVWGVTSLSANTQTPATTNTTPVTTGTTVKGNTTPVTVTIPKGTTQTTPTTGSTAGLSITSPQDAGMAVAVGSATVSAPTWVIVYDSVNGAPGKALGATMFFPENNGKGGVVTLLRPTMSGQTYIVGERTDNGDHVFSSEDSRVVDASGNAVWWTFKTK